MNNAKSQSTSTVDQRLVACYVRVSRKESFRGDSPAIQEARFREIAAAEGWTNIEVFAEPKPVKGQEPLAQRPAMARLLQRIAVGKVGIVIARATDRLGRGAPLDELLEILRDAEIELHTFTGKQDIYTASGRLGLGVRAVVGDYESRVTGERVRENRRRKVIDGYWPNQAPYGYTSRARFRRQLFDRGMEGNRAREEAERKYPREVLQIEPEEADIVRRIYDLYESGFGTSRIAKLLRNEGLTYRNGTRWRPQNVRKILRTPVVAGFTHFDDRAYEAHRASKLPAHKQRLYPGKHDEIIDLARWEAVQAIMDARGSRRKALVAECRVYPLTGVLRDVHGHPMQGTSSGQGSHAYYVCRHRKSGEACSAPRIPVDEIEQAMKDLLSSLRLTPERITRLVEMVNEGLGRQVTKHRSEQQTIQGEIEARTQHRERCLRRAGEERDDVIADLHIEAARACSADIADLHERLTMLQDSPPPAIAKPLIEAEVRGHLEALFNPIQSLVGLQDILFVLKDQHSLRVTLRDRHEARVEMNLDPTVFRAQRHPLRLLSGPEAYLPFVADITVGVPRQTVEEWVIEQQGKHICACGCGEAIEIKPQHKAPTKGIPKFIQGHHRMNMTEFVQQMNAKGLLTVSQAAAEVGVSENTLRRAEAKGWITPERSKWGNRQPMRLYRKEDLPSIRQQLVDAGFRFRDEAGVMNTDEMAAALGISKAHPPLS